MQKNKKKGLIKVINKTEEWTKDELEILKSTSKNESGQKLIRLLPSKQLISIFQKKKELGIPLPKRTYEDAVQIMKEKSYILLSPKEDYKNVSSKLSYLCPIHKDKGVLTTTLSHLIEGKGCPYCGLTRQGVSRQIKLDKDEAIELCRKHDFEFIDIYRENSIIYISFICNKHREFGIQRMRKGNMKRDIHGCQYCSHKNLPKDFLLEQLNLKAPNIELLENFEKLSDRVKCKCTIHNHIMERTISSILRNPNCYFCGLEQLSRQALLSREEIEEKVNKKNPHIKLIKYNGALDSNSVWYCTKHHKEFNKCYSTIISSESGCDECYKERMQLQCGVSKEEFLKRLSLAHPEIKLIEGYTVYNSPAQFYCEKHKYYFTDIAKNVVLRNTCCAKGVKYSKQEEMCLILESWGYKIEREKVFQDCKDKGVLPFDCYIKDFNVVCEYDGEGHYMPINYNGCDIKTALQHFDYVRKHDEIKNEYCKQKNIPIIRVPYYEQDDMEYFLFDGLAKLGVIEEITA